MNHTTRKVIVDEVYDLFRDKAGVAETKVDALASFFGVTFRKNRYNDCLLQADRDRDYSSYLDDIKEDVLSRFAAQLAPILDYLELELIHKEPKTVPAHYEVKKKKNKERAK